jgi:hypothetical protein
MRTRKFQVSLQVVIAIAISAFLVFYLNKDYPKVGHDYYYFIPRLIDVLLHYKVNGLSIQWYTPSFGGGLPGYPNPENIQFSLPQLLTMIVNPWAACLISTVVFALAGYFSMQFFLKRILSFSWQASVLGGLFFTINGFYIEHMAVGHLGYQGFPLLPILFIALFAEFLPPFIAASILALVFAALIHQAGFIVIVIFILSSLVILPILYAINPRLFIFKRLARILLFGSLFSGLIAGSKIYAVYSLMRYFPRNIADHYNVTSWTALKA